MKKINPSKPSKSVKLKKSLSEEVYLERGFRRKASPSFSATVPSPQMSSRTNHSASEPQNIWERKLDTRRPSEFKSEQKKYSAYRNIHHNPASQGIEFWEDDDKRRMEMINAGEEANRRIRKAASKVSNSFHQSVIDKNLNSICTKI